MAKFMYFNTPVDALLLMHFQHILRSKKPLKTRRERQRMSEQMSHLGLDSLGKQEMVLNIQMITCGTLDISRILLGCLLCSRYLPL